jgi:hypothetical protein
MDANDPKQIAPLEHALDDVRDFALRSPGVTKDSGELVRACGALARLLESYHGEGATPNARNQARALAATALLYLVRTDARTAEDIASPEFVQRLVKRRGLDWLLEEKGKKT